VRERELQGSLVKGSLDVPAKSDFLLATDTNVSASKSNADLTRTIQYTVRNDGRRLVAEVRITYRNDGERTAINPYYSGLTRLYVPAGSSVIADQWGTEVLARDGGFEVFAQTVVVQPKSTAVRIFRYRLPEELARGGRYRLVWRRQPGTAHDALRFAGWHSDVDVPVRPEWRTSVKTG